MSKPNILFIMTDQQRWDALGCSGGWVQTPNLDSIASKGIRFTQCVTTSPVCIPARVSMATGRYPHNTGVWKHMQFTLPPDTSTWMQAVRKAGYRTSLFGKTHLHPHHGDLRDRVHLLKTYGLDDVDEIGGPRANTRLRSNMTEMWERKGLWAAYQQDFLERYSNKPYIVRPSVLPLEDYADVYVGQQAMNYLAQYDRAEPWFCWVSFGGPHEPWDTPEPYASMYDPETMPEPVPRPKDDYPHPKGGLDEQIAHPGPKLEPGDVAKMRADYAGNITLIDDQIGQILEAIAQRGDLDNTVIVFTSDHGEMNGDYGLIYKENFLNGAVRVPLLILIPKMIDTPLAGQVNHSPVEWFDVGPTLVELAGGTIQHQQFAQSLCPVLADPTKTHRPEAVSEFDGEIMIMNQRWKMALNQQGQPYLLFDLQNDPQETHNLAGLPRLKPMTDKLLVRIHKRLAQTKVTDNVL